MAAPTFTPPRQPAPGMKKKPRLSVLEARYGDGYSQRAKNGLNARRRSWTLTWPGLRRDQAKTVEDFFDARGGAEAFWWTPPSTWPVDAGSAPYAWPANPGPVLVSCKDYERIEEGPNVDTINATFDEEFDIGA